MLVLAVMIAAGYFAVLVAPAQWSSCEKFEVVRLLSPAGDVEAVVVEWDGGATTDVGHDVYLVPPGGSVTRCRPAAEFYGAMLNARAWGVACRWSAANELTVEYDHARSADLNSATPIVAGHEIVVELVSGTTIADLDGRMVDRSRARAR